MVTPLRDVFCIDYWWDHWFQWINHHWSKECKGCWCFILGNMSFHRNGCYDTKHAPWPRAVYASGASCDWVEKEVAKKSGTQLPKIDSSSFFLTTLTIVHGHTWRIPASWIRHTATIHWGLDLFHWPISLALRSACSRHFPLPAMGTFGSLLARGTSCRQRQWRMVRNDNRSTIVRS